MFEWEIGRGQSLAVARTAVVNMLVVGELVYLFNARHFVATSLARDTLYGNPVAFWAAIALLGVQLVFTYSATMHRIFGSGPLDGASWALIAALSAAVFVAVEAEKALLRRCGVLRM